MFVGGLTLVACNKKAEPMGEQPVEKSAQPVAEVAAKPAGVAAAVLPAEGKKYDPPVAASKIPIGAWYCAMDTVHFARGEKGDGKCPICGMDLKEKTAADDKDEHKHEHGDDSHKHGPDHGHSHKDDDHKH